VQGGFEVVGVHVVIVAQVPPGLVFAA
jgi:hypothetical protein